MREQLKHLEGKLVVLRGRVASARVSENHRYYFCVSNPKISPWDGIEPLKTAAFKNSVRADHVWVNTSDNVNWPQLYEKHFLVGTCGYYTRKDHSIDLSITKTAAILNGQKFLWDIENVLRSKRSEAQRIDKALEMLSYLSDSLIHHGDKKDGMDHYVYGTDWSVHEITDRLLAMHKDVLQRQRALALESVRHLKPVAQKPGSMLFLNQPTQPKHQTAVERLLGGNR